MRAFRRALVPLALALLLTVPAVADHVYSHRYVVQGRVTAADGLPMENVTVRLQVDFPYSGLCHEMPNSETDAWGPTMTNPRTNAFGEWSYCIHAHAMERDADYAINARLEDETVRAVATADPLLRRSTMHVVADAATGNGTTEWDESYTVSGRLWEDTGARSVEGVQVYGMTLNDAPVTVRYARDGEGLANVHATTNGYGDFAVRLDVADVRAADEVVLEWGERSWSLPPDATTRWSDFSVDVANVTEDADADPDPGANGSGDATQTRNEGDGDASTPPAGVPLALAGVLAAAVVLAHPRRRGRS